MNGDNRQCFKTIKATTHHRLTQEIKFLNIKKEKLYERLCKKKHVQFFLKMNT